VIIHHLSVGANDLERARRFYDAVMATLGLRLMKRRGDEELIYGANAFLLSVQRPADGAPATAGHGAHVAFAAESRAMVDRFHAEGLAHGGRDAGAPGVRTRYDPHYYCAFLLDPDGNKLEAVTFSSR
jgi:catechol 2,3-dioxygenase-like lactoylglutathione lyase family enzyme